MALMQSYRVLDNQAMARVRRVEAFFKGRQFDREIIVLEAQHT